MQNRTIGYSPFFGVFKESTGIIDSIIGNKASLGVTKQSCGRRESSRVASKEKEAMLIIIGHGLMY